MKPVLLENTGATKISVMCEQAYRHMPVGAVLISENGDILDINTKGRQLLNMYAADNSVPENIFKIFDPAFREVGNTAMPLTRVVRNEKFTDEKYIFLNRQSGEKLHLLCSGVPLADNDGNFSGGILFLDRYSDSPEPEHLAEALELQNADFKTQLASYKKQLRNDNELLQSIIDKIPVMITIYDARVESIILNPAVTEITGWAHKDLVKHNIMELAYPEPAYRKEVYEFMESLSPKFKDITMRTKDGRDIETSWANVKIPDGRQVGVGIDISGRKQLERDLRLARAKAEEENHVQYAFIQNISHDVRTPMNSILGFTELLQGQCNDKKHTDFLNAIAFNGKQLLRLIDDIIDFSRLDKKELALSKQTIDIDRVMAQIKNMVPGLKKAYNKPQLNVGFVVPAPREKTIMLFTDTHRLQQIFANLISNALKFTNQGSIEIGYRIQPGLEEVVFFVKDTGIGIREADHRRVFTRFHQMHDQAQTDFRGTGLGLAICKHLVDLLGGEIGFKSAPNVGSEFYFSHPFTEGLAQMPTETAEPHHDLGYTPDLSRCTMLIVEDDEFSYQMMFHMLAETNARILHADNGPAAIEILQDNTVDLVFLDIRLPGMNGFEVLKWIRKNYRYIPVVAQTANALTEDREKIAEAGFDTYISKPISQSALFTIVNQMIK
jgi:PAS domain S-box-containing protein